jgi:hypothetical protein
MHPKQREWDALIILHWRRMSIMSNLIDHATSLFGEDPAQMVGLKRVSIDGFVPYKMGVRPWTDNYLYKLNEKLWAIDDNLTILNWLNSSNIDVARSKKPQRYSHERINAKNAADKYHQVVRLVNNYVNEGSRTTANYNRTNAKIGRAR